MNQRGFITLPLMAWGAIGAGVVMLGLSAAVWVQTSRLDAAKAETVAVQGRFDTFAAQAKAVGEAQTIRAKALDAANADLKEKIDEITSKSRADLDALYAKYNGLRNSRKNPNSGGLPPAPAVTSSTPRTCFDTAKLAGAMGVLEAGVPVITQQGDVARLRLSSSVEWAKSLAK